MFCYRGGLWFSFFLIMCEVDDEVLWMRVSAISSVIDIIKFREDTSYGKTSWFAI